VEVLDNYISLHSERALRIARLSQRKEKELNQQGNQVLHLILQIKEMIFKLQILQGILRVRI